MEGHHMLAPLYELADGDVGFFNEIVDSMAKAIPENINQLQKGLEKGDIVSISRGAHHMKSSIMYTNASELREILTAIEQQNNISKLEEIRSLMPRIIELAKELSDIIKSEEKK